MMLTCPSCASSFRIDPDKLGPEGRSVRCGACRETWFVSPAEVIAAQAEALGAAPASASPPKPEPDADLDTDLDAWGLAEAAVAEPAQGDAAPAPPPEAAPPGPVLDNVPPAPRRKGKPRGRPAKKAPKRKGLSPAAAAVLALIAALPLACLARVPIVRAMPQTAGLYARIGLLVNLRGIEIRDVDAFRNPGGPGQPAELVIEGDILGVARGDAPVPPMEVEIRDGDGRTLTSLPVPAPRAVLAEGERARFRARFLDSPEAGRSIEVRFADAEPGTDARRAH